jgi:hypothetical protein
MPTRQQLHELVDRLPEGELAAAQRVRSAFVADPVELSLLAAPLDDEPYTEEQRREDEEARRGPRIPHEDLKRELGL